MSDRCSCLHDVLKERGLAGAKESVKAERKTVIMNDLRHGGW